MILYTCGQNFYVMFIDKVRNVDYTYSIYIDLNSYNTPFIMNCSIINYMYIFLRVCLDVFLFLMSYLKI